MSRITENRAKEYLFNNFKSDRYRFVEKQPAEDGFDLWMKNLITKEKHKIELKATGSDFSRNSDIFQKLVFSAKNEVENFEKGVTKVLRIFMGSKPPKIFIFDNRILSDGARFEAEYRAKIKGRKNYDCIKEIGGE